MQVKIQLLLLSGLIFIVSKAYGGDNENLNIFGFLHSIFFNQNPDRWIKKSVVPTLFKQDRISFIVQKSDNFFN
jgi:hypothetical protein